MSKDPDNYFTRLGLSIAVEIESDRLNAHYFEQQRQWHPDRFAGKPAAERQQALHEAMLLNEAYETLKNPLKRSEYLLLLQGMKVNTETNSIKPSPLVLMHAMEVRERLMEAENLESVQQLENETLAEKEALFKQFASAYNGGNLNQAAQHVIQLRYNEKLIEEIKIKRKKYALT